MKDRAIDKAVSCQASDLPMRGVLLEFQAPFKEWS